MPATCTLPHEAWTGSTYLNLLDPDPDDIHLDEVLGGLCRIRRYAGLATKDPWSVGQHTILCDIIAEKRGLTQKVRRTLLLHDGPEYVLGDVIAPLKCLIKSVYGPLEDRLYSVMAEKFDLIDPIPAVVKEIDQAAWAAEKSALVAEESGPWLGMPPEAPEAIPEWLRRAPEVFVHTRLRKIACRFGLTIYPARRQVFAPQTGAFSL